MTETCPHGSVERSEEMPLCGARACLWRWWFRFGLPFLLVLAGIVVLGLAFRPQWGCPDGSYWSGPGSCIRR